MANYEMRDNFIKVIMLWQSFSLSKKTWIMALNCLTDNGSELYSVLNVLRIIRLVFRTEDHTYN